MVEPISTLKAAYDAAKALLDVHGAVKIDAQVFQLQRLILDAQEQEAVHAREKRALEERVKELEAWNGETERYELQKIGAHSSLAYGLRSEFHGAEPDHQLCASCYGRRCKSILQPHIIPEGRAEVLMCHECDGQILIRGVADTRTVNSRRAPGSVTFGRVTRS